MQGICWKGLGLELTGMCSISLLPGKDSLTLVLRAEWDAFISTIYGKIFDGFCFYYLAEKQAERLALETESMLSILFTLKMPKGKYIFVGTSMALAIIAPLQKLPMQIQNLRFMSLPSGPLPQKRGYLPVVIL